MAEKTRNRRNRKEILVSSLSELDSRIQKEEELLEKLKAQRAAFQKELAEIKIAEEKAAEPEKTTEKKTMSIAERARLASSLEESESEDKTEKPDESETADIASEEKTDE